MKRMLRINSRPVPIPEWGRLNAVRDAWRSCANYLYSRFSGIKSLLLVQDFRAVRNMLVRDGVMRSFPLQARQWKMCLAHVLSNIKTTWSNIHKKCVKAVMKNSCLDKAEKHYLCFVFKVKEVWQSILMRTKTGLPDRLKQQYEQICLKISGERFHYLHNLVCRLTRKYKPCISHMNDVRTMEVDEGSYQFVEEKDGSVSFRIMSLKRGERISIPVSHKYPTDKGTLQIVIDEERHIVSIRKFTETNSAVRNRKNPVRGKRIGLDKGYSTMVSLSTGNEYGEGFGQILSAVSDRLDHKNRKRQPYYARIREINKALEVSSLSDKERVKLTRLRDNILENNLGKKKYNAQKHRMKEVLRSFINHHLIVMFKTERPEQIIMEDLSFVVKSGKGSPHYRGRTTNRRLSSWLKGYLDERIEFQAERFCAKTKKVNAAYTSQYCSQCGRKIRRNNDFALCPQCGKLNANINAAVNILNRADDKKISLYTPCPEVRKIMRSRSPV